MNKKTNIEYLRDCIKGNEEANEFLDAVIKEIKAKDKRVKALEDDCDCDEYEDRSYENTIDTGMEPLEWSCPNLGIISLMETFEEKLEKLGHIRLEAAIKSL